MLNKIGEFINDKACHITIYENEIYMVNYSRIISLEENNITIIGKQKKYSIIGNNLKPKRILKEEILIEGDIKKLEVFHE